MSLTDPGSVATIFSTCPDESPFSDFLVFRIGSGHDSPRVSSSWSKSNPFPPFVLMAATLSPVARPLARRSVERAAEIEADGPVGSRFCAYGQRAGELVLEAQRLRGKRQPLLVDERQPIGEPFAHGDHLVLRGRRAGLGNAGRGALETDVVEADRLRDRRGDRLAA